MEPSEDEELLAALPAASPIEAVRMAFAKYAMFTGRASRSEFWWWTLVTSIVSALLATAFVAIVSIGATTTRTIDDAANATTLAMLTLGALLVWGAAIVVPTLAVTTRRLRDTGVPASLALLCVVPSGALVLLVLAGRPTGASTQAPPPPAPVLHRVHGRHEVGRTGRFARPLRPGVRRLGDTQGRH